MKYQLRRLLGGLAWLRRVSVVAVIAVGAPILAQTIDPSILQRVQGSLGVGAGNALGGFGAGSAGQLDASRSQGDQRAEALENTPGSTSEELELRRQRSRLQLQRFYVPSPIEREYRERTGDPNLRQFGYDLFRSTEGSGGGQVTGEVGNGYILGVGDELVVSFQGATSDSRTTRVDREGRLVVGQLRPIRAAGRSLGAVRSDLAAETRRTLLGTEVYVSVGSVRAISVFVGGEVERPGQYQLTSLGDVANALARAGGVRRNGSLRRIRVVRGGGSLTVDLYGLLGIGSPSTVRLQDGDRIIVPVIGDTAALSGSVARPAIYELRGPVSVGAFIDYAGGAVRPRGNKIAISRIAADGTESFVRAVGNGQGVLPGDAVQVVGGSAGGTAGRILLRGYVLNPGARPLGAASTVRELLGSPADLRDGSYLPMAILVRRDPVTSARVYEPVNLISALGAGPSVPLRSADQLFIFGQSDIEFLNRASVRRIILGQPNPEPLCRSLDRLQAIVADTQSSRFLAITRGSFIVRRQGRADLETATTTANADRGLRRDEEVTAELERQRQELDRLQNLNRNNNNPAATEERRLTDLTEAERATLLRREAQEREIENREQNIRLGGVEGVTNDVLCPAVFEDDPELLPVLIENAVAVGGAVRRPGAYPVAGAVSAAALISVAQGASGRSDDATLDVTRSTSTNSTTERFAVDPARAALSQVTLRAGDDLRLNAGQPQVESGAVLLTGEFQRPGLYTFRKGETLSQLMTRAGGLTTQAYTYGAVYTRASVKALQEEGLRRTAREINTGLLAAISRRGGDSSGLAAAGQLVRELSSLDVPGRMVVESDPSVLTVRPELDTVLEPGDAIYMPKRPNFVLVLGDVNNPTALQFISDKHATDYLKEAGGTSSTADRGRIFIVLPNGTAQPLKSSRGDALPPGTTVIVPKNIDPLRTLDFIRDVTQIFAQVATSIATVAILATN